MQNIVFLFKNYVKFDMISQIYYNIIRYKNLFLKKGGHVMSKYVYAENFKFITGDGNIKIFRNPYMVREKLGFLPIHLIVTPLTSHPYLNFSNKTLEVKSTRLVSLEEKDGFWEARSNTGTIYRLITE